MTVHLSIDRPAMMPSRARRGTRSFRKGFALALMLLFLGLRAVTSGPSINIDAAGIGSQTAQQNLPMTAAGMALLVALIPADAAMTFVFILCDMNGFGAFFDTDQWGVAHMFKFRDLEMALLMATGALFWMLRSGRAHERSTRLSRYLARVAVIIASLTILYTLVTLRVQDLATTLRYSRQLFVWLLLLIAPQFIRSFRDVRRMTAVLVAYVGAAAVLYVAQALSPPQTVLRYSQQIMSGDQVRTWAASVSPIFIGAIAIFAYQLQASRPRRYLWIVFGICAVAIVMSQGRMLTGVFASSIGIMVLHRAIVTHRIGLAIRVGVTAVLVFAASATILWSANRLDPLIEIWNKRIDDIQTDVRVHQGSMTSRYAMIVNLPMVIHRNGGGILATWFGMGLRAMKPSDLAPLIFWGEISPPIWADNGLAGVAFTAGYIGITLLLLFVVTMLWRLRAQLGRSSDPICRSATIAALLYFAFSLPYMFFSAHFFGTWDDALAIVVLLVVIERSAATLRWRRVAA